jgi:hypothetical protein
VCHILLSNNAGAASRFMSIFQKHCPECAAPNANGAISCNCGYCFDPEALASADPSAYADQQDHLYRDYLEARIAQAESELIVAREQANTDPSNTYKASGALLAAQSLNALLAEMKQLSSHISSAPPVRRPSVVARPVAGVPPISTSVKITPVARPNAPLTPKTLPAPAMARKQTARIATPAVAAKALPKPISKPLAAAARAKAPSWRNAPKAAVPKKAPNPLAAIVSKAKAAVIARAATPDKKVATALPRKPVPVPARREIPKAAKPVEIARPPINGQHRAVAPSVSHRPDESFRRIQAQKADAITRPKTPSTPPQHPSANKPAPQRPPADIPPVTLLKQTAMTHECPNCTASVAADQARCTCGYVLSSPGQEVPAVSLDATALAILTEGISFFSPNRRR